MRIIFMGTPEPAAKVLQDLISSHHEIVCVVTQPDRPKGRGRKIAFPAVKEVALKHNLPLEQPEKVNPSTQLGINAERSRGIKNNKVFVSLLKSFKPDVIVVVAYGKILPKEILDIPKNGCLNVHASLLPKYRGAAPIQWALLNGEKETGVTIMWLDEGLDTGPIVLQTKVKIEEQDDSITLLKKVFDKGGPLLLKALEQVESGRIQYIQQNNAQATYAPMIQKESGELDFKKSATEVLSRIRALVPWPGAHTFRAEKLLKIWRAESQAGPKDLPGKIVEIIKNVGFVVATGEGNLLVLEVQSEGKKRISAYDYVIGHDVKIGEILPN